MSAISRSDIDDEKDSRFGAYGYECLALWQHRDEYIGYIWVPWGHPLQFDTALRTEYRLSLANSTDVKCRHKTYTFRLDNKGVFFRSVERRFADRLDCVLALTEVARAMRERAEQHAANFPLGTYDTWDRTRDAQAGDTQPEGD